MAKEHFLEQHDPDRKDFQIDRIILFSDAVFAIAITLLIIEIKAPVVGRDFTAWQMLAQLGDLWPKFFGFFLSFFVIATYWRSHHRTFGFVCNYNDRLIWLNFRFLLTIVIMPFTSAYYGESGGHSIPFLFYHTNIIFTSLTNYMLVKYVFNPDNGIIAHRPDPVFKKMFLARGVAIPVIFLFGMLISPFSMIVSRLSPILIWPVFYIIRTVYNRRSKKYRKENIEEYKADEEESHLS